MCVYVELPVIGIFGVCSQDFLGFASLSGVFPLSVIYIYSYRSTINLELEPA